MIQDNIIHIARSMIGVPFRHQGRSPDTGFDCAGLIAYITKQLGIDYIESEPYGRTPAKGLMRSMFDKQPCLSHVSKSDKLPGDILLMRFFKEPQHVAIFTGENIIHTYEAVRKVCEHRMTAVWEKRIVCAYRFNI